MGTGLLQLVVFLFNKVLDLHIAVDYSKSLSQ